MARSWHACGAERPALQRASATCPLMPTQLPAISPFPHHPPSTHRHVSFPSQLHELLRHLCQLSCARRHVAILLLARGADGRKSWPEAWGRQQGMPCQASCCNSGRSMSHASHTCEPRSKPKPNAAAHGRVWSSSPAASGFCTQQVPNPPTAAHLAEMEGHAVNHHQADGGVLRQEAGQQLNHR